MSVGLIPILRETRCAESMKKFRIASRKPGNITHQLIDGVKLFVGPMCRHV
jgi:hypothetical protein